MGFTGDGSAANREITTGMQGAVVKERAFYKILPEQLRSIASAKEVKIKLQGSNRFVTRTLAQKNFDNFKRFVAEYVDK